jgi:cytochrome c oxidase subunit 1
VDYTYTPPVHGNWGDKLPTVYRWAYDYSVPGAKSDFIPQNMAEEDVEMEASAAKGA